MKKIILSTTIILALAISAFFAWNIYSEKSEFQEAAKEEKIEILKEQAKSYQNGINGYDIANVEKYYKEIFVLDPKNQDALFQLSRVSYIQGKFQQSLVFADISKKLYPYSKRIYYVSGLANGFAKNLEEAEKDFEIFVNSDVVNEAGFLDLAWVQFQKGEFQKAKENLQKGIDFTGGYGNAWLSLSMGAVLLNLDEKEKAQEFLEKAKSQAENITPQVWAINYSANDSKNYQKDINKLKEIVDFNLALAKGKDLEEGKILKLSGLYFEGLSPKGPSGGYVVSASCAAGDQYGKECESEANKCGKTEKGKISCDNKCKNGTAIVSKPAVVYTHITDPSTVCKGELAGSLTCDSQRAEFEYGTKTNEYCSCTEGQTWNETTKKCETAKTTNSNNNSSTNCLNAIPKSSEVCQGVVFTQKCSLTSRTSILTTGTKDCSSITTKPLPPTTNYIEKNEDGTYGNSFSASDITPKIQCSLDKSEWNDCSNVIKISLGDEFYTRNSGAKEDESENYLCNESVNKISSFSNNNSKFIFSDITEDNYKLKIHTLSLKENIDKDIFEEKFVGICGSNSAEKKIKIKVLDIQEREI